MHLQEGVPRTTPRRVRPPSGRATGDEAELALAPPAAAASAATALSPRGRTDGAVALVAVAATAGGAAAAGTTTEEDKVVRGDISRDEAVVVEPADGAAGLGGQRLHLLQPREINERICVDESVGGGVFRRITQAGVRSGGKTRQRRPGNDSWLVVVPSSCDFLAPVCIACPHP